MITPDVTVAHAVLEHPEYAPVFQRYRIDYCCKGDVTIARACEARGVAPAVVMEALDRARTARSGAPAPDLRSMSTASLVAHVITTHHAFLRGSLPAVRALAAKVQSVHGAHHPRLVEVSTIVGQLVGALVPHLDDEEEELFPALMARTPPQAQVSTLLARMHEEHLVVGGLLEQLRVAAEDYRVPDWACASYRALFAQLERVEADTLQHVHVENHILMPRFMPV